MLRRSRISTRAAGAAAAVAGLLVAASLALAAGTPAGGTVHIYGTPGNGSGTKALLLTGAIGDYGKAVRETATGTPSKKGASIHFMLKKGTFVGDGTALFTKLNTSTPSFDKATCSIWESVTSPVPLSSGTGHYKGISGTVNVTITFAGIGPRFKKGPHKGKCNTSQSAPSVAQYEAIAGSGKVSF